MVEARVALCIMVSSERTDTIARECVAASRIGYENGGDVWNEVNNGAQTGNGGEGHGGRRRSEDECETKSADRQNRVRFTPLAKAPRRSVDPCGRPVDASIVESHQVQAVAVYLPILLDVSTKRQPWEATKSEKMEKIPNNIFLLL